jgi:hypothetical protein
MILSVINGQNQDEKIGSLALKGIKPKKQPQRGINFQARQTNMTAIEFTDYVNQQLAS